MKKNTAISITDVSKKFRLFNSPKERLAEALHPFKKTFHKEFWALKNISFDVKKGEIFGILGRNGSGKSTLLQIICAVMQPTSGKVLTNGKISALLELGAGFNPEFTGRENVYLNGSIAGRTRDEMNLIITQIEEFSDIGQFFDQPVKTYSSGMYVRVAFAAAIHIDPEILIIDEALSVGDTKFTHRCFNRIQSFMEQGKTIIVVSHDTSTLLRICQRGAVIENGELAYVGPIATAVNTYQELLFGNSKDRELNDGVNENSENTDNFLRGNKENVTSNPLYNKHETRMGNQAVEIIDFEIRSNKQSNPVEITRYSQVEIRLKIYFHKSLSNISLGFALLSTEGIYIYGTNLSLQGRELISRDAGETLIAQFSFQSVFSGGEYFLNLGCNQMDGENDNYIDVRRSIAKLNFEQTPGNIGFVDLDLKYEQLDNNDS